MLVLLVLALGLANLLLLFRLGREGRHQRNEYDILSPRLPAKPRRRSD